jgi:anti-sigma regulatory factor (Ser/Thr protein kinase)
LIGIVLRSARFEFRTREEAVSIARWIGALVPDTACVEFALLELMINAIEHGNLEIGAMHKSELVGRGELDAEIARRIANPIYRDRLAWLDVQRNGADIAYTVGDAGPGFVWRELADAPANQPSGRGLALVRQLAHSLEFNAAGNVVTVRLP